MNTVDTPPKCVGYTRVSSLDQAESGIGIEVQTERIKAYWSYRLGSYAWGGLYCDEAVSGACPFLKRPAGRELAKNLRRGDQIVISTLDRSFRTMREGWATIQQWDDSGIGVHILDIGDGQPIDVRSASGRFFIQMMLAAAEFEYRRICERNKYAADKRKARGIQPIGRQAAIGQKWDGRKGKRKIVDDPHDLSVMRHIVKWHHQGWSLHHCFRTLWHQHVKTSKGKYWARRRVYRAYHAEMNKLLKLGLVWVNGYDDRGGKSLQWLTEEARDRYFAGDPLDAIVKAAQSLIVPQPESAIRIWKVAVMLCPACNGRRLIVSHHASASGERVMTRPCPECSGYGITHCCDGLQAQPRDGECDGRDRETGGGIVQPLPGRDRGAGGAAEREGGRGADASGDGRSP